MGLQIRQVGVCWVGKVPVPVFGFGGGVRWGGEGAIFGVCSATGVRVCGHRHSDPNPVPLKPSTSTNASIRS